MTLKGIEEDDQRGVRRVATESERNPKWNACTGAHARTTDEIRGLAKCIGTMPDGHRRCIRRSVNRLLHRVDWRDRHTARFDIAPGQQAQILAMMRGHHLHADRYAVHE